MPLSKEAQRAWQEKPPRRDVHHDTVAPMTRFGRKWLWDLTLNVPVHLLAEALETAAPPPDATTPYLRKNTGLMCRRWSRLGQDLRRPPELGSRTACAARSWRRSSRLQTASTKETRSRRTSVQFVLWSQWRQGAGFVKKLPSWAEHPPPRSARAAARCHLVACSRRFVGGGGCVP